MSELYPREPMGEEEARAMSGYVRHPLTDEWFTGDPAQVLLDALADAHQQHVNAEEQAARLRTALRGMLDAFNTIEVAARLPADVFDRAMLAIDAALTALGGTTSRGFGREENNEGDRLDDSGIYDDSPAAKAQGGGDA